MTKRSLIATGLLVLASGAGARADTLLTPLAGAAFSGATDRSRATFGAALGFLGDGVVGFEAEFATTPDFFGGSDQREVFTRNNVVTLMGSFLLATPGGRARLYGAAGAGLMKTRVESSDRFFDVDSNDFGVNLGGGVIAYLSDHVGLRGDVRYFRDLSDLKPNGTVEVQLGNKVDYWRGVVGLTLKF